MLQTDFDQEPFDLTHIDALACCLKPKPKDNRFNNYKPKREK